MDNAGRVAGGDLAADLSNSRNSVRQNKLTFPILSDAKGEVAAAFGLRFRLPDYLVEVYQGLKNNLPLFNDDRSWTRPMPARYVIGQDTTIQREPRLHAPA